MKRIIIATIVGLALCGSAWAAEGDWPKEMKDAFVDRCASAMNGEGLPLNIASGYCRCMIDAQEIEFGNRDAEAMLKAEPDPNGSDIEKRLAQVLASCRGWLPKK